MYSHSNHIPSSKRVALLDTPSPPYPTPAAAEPSRAVHSWSAGQGPILKVGFLRVWFRLEWKKLLIPTTSTHGALNRCLVEPIHERRRKKNGSTIFLWVHNLWRATTRPTPSPPSMSISFSPCRFYLATSRKNLNELWINLREEKNLGETGISCGRD